MPVVAIVFGLLLMLLGFGTYFAAPPEHQSLTALIPSVFGALLVIFGAVACKPGLRKHAMHATAVVALLGAVGALWRAIGGLIAGKSAVSLAIGAQLTMGILCVIFLILCIRSFRAARLARQAIATE